MKGGSKTSEGSICERGKRQHKRVSSAKDRRVSSSAPTRPSSNTTKGASRNNRDADETCHHHKRDSKKEENVSVEKKPDNIPSTNVDGGKNDTPNNIHDVTTTEREVESDTDSESENTQSCLEAESVEQKKPVGGASGERQYITVDMNLGQNLEENGEDDVFIDNNFKKDLDDDKAHRTSRPMSRDDKKDNALKPINECDESSIVSSKDGEPQDRMSNGLTSETGAIRKIPEGNLVSLEKKEKETDMQDNQTKSKTTKRPKSEKYRRPISSNVACKQKRRPFSATASGRPCSGSDGTIRGSYVPSSKFTKEELDYYLPRRSFFSCHDKALRDAGYDTGKTPRKSRLIEAWAKYTNEASVVRTPTPHNLTNDLDSGTLPTAMEDLENAPEQPHDVESFPDLGRDSMSSITHSHDHKLTRQSSSSSIRIHGPLTRKTSRTSRRRGDDEDEVRVDYQTLLQYLKYISENPDDYLHYRKNNQPDVSSNDTIVKMGNIFRRGRHGHSTDSLLVYAVHDINPRFSDPSQWTNTNNEKQLLGLTSSKKDSSMFLVAKKEPHDSGTGNDEPKTDFEKIKSKMEAWLKTVTTAQLVKAKELALRDLGEEDVSQSKW